MLNNSQNQIIEHLFTVSETACYMRISRATLWKHRKSGKINSLRAGRKILFKKEDIDKFLSLNSTALVNG